MSQSKFIQIHTLTSYPASLLNRDDAGFAKRMPFGGTTRTRISSQCLKYHWRNFEGENALYGMDVPHSLRSRETFKRKIAKPLINDGYPEPLVLAATHALKERVVSDKNASKSSLKKILNPGDKDDPWEEVATSQITILGAPETNYLKNLIRDQLDDSKDTLSSFWTDGDGDIEEAIKVVNGFDTKELKKNLKGLQLASGLDAAMFGRMVTSDILARGDAALHVAHALTTHAEESESDYFSAVDELRRDEPEESGELGAGHINSTELTSGLFYNYVVIDVPLLVSNLEGIDRQAWKEADHSLSAEVIKRMIHLITTVSPGAKLGSTAPYSYADFVMVETGSSQPRTLANAFRKAVTMNGSDVLTNSYQALANHTMALDKMYGKRTDRRVAAIELDESIAEKLGVNEPVSIDEIADWAVSQVGA